MTSARTQFLDRLAFITSAVTSPFIILTLFSLWIVAAQAHTLKQFLIWAGLAVFFIVLIPFVHVGRGVRRGLYTDFHLMLREQRTAPFAIATASVLTLAGVYFAIDAPRKLLAMAIVQVITGLAFLLATHVSKISVHTASLVGSIVMVGLLVNKYAFVLLLLVPVVIWARVRRKRHNILQTVAASLLISSIILSIFILLRIL